MLYLLLMAWRTWRGGQAFTVEAAPDRPAALRIVLGAIGLNLFNPKLPLFFLAFLPQFIDPLDPHPLLRMVELGAGFMGLTFAVFAVYGAFAASARNLLVRRPATLVWLRRSFACAFALMGFRLALAG